MNTASVLSVRGAVVSHKARLLQSGMLDFNSSGGDNKENRSEVEIFIEIKDARHRRMGLPEVKRQ